MMSERAAQDRSERAAAREARFTDRLVQAAERMDEHRVRDVYALFQFTLDIENPQTAKNGMDLAADLGARERLLYGRIMIARYTLGVEGVARAFANYEAQRV